MESFNQYKRLCKTLPLTSKVGQMTCWSFCPYKQWSKQPPTAFSQICICV